MKFLKGLYQPTLDVWRNYFLSSKMAALAFFFIGFLSALYVFVHIREDGMDSDLSISFAMIALAIWFLFLPALICFANIWNDKDKNNMKDDEESDDDDDDDNGGSYNKPEPPLPSNTGDVDIDKVLENLTKPSSEKIEV